MVADQTTHEHNYSVNYSSDTSDTYHETGSEEILDGTTTNASANFTENDFEEDNTSNTYSSSAEFSNGNNSAGPNGSGSMTATHTYSYSATGTYVVTSSTAYYTPQTSTSTNLLEQDSASANFGGTFGNAYGYDYSANGVTNDYSTNDGNYQGGVTTVSYQRSGSDVTVEGGSLGYGTSESQNMAIAVNEQQNETSTYEDHWDGNYSANGYGSDYNDYVIGGQQGSFSYSYSAQVNGSVTTGATLATWHDENAGDSNYVGHWHGWYGSGSSDSEDGYSWTSNGSDQESFSPTGTSESWANSYGGSDHWTWVNGSYSNEWTYGNSWGNSNSHSYSYDAAPQPWIIGIVGDIVPIVTPGGTREGYYNGYGFGYGRWYGNDYGLNLDAQIGPAGAAYTKTVGDVPDIEAPDIGNDWKTPGRDPLYSTASAGTPGTLEPNSGASVVQPELASYNPQNVQPVSTEATAPQSPSAAASVEMESPAWQGTKAFFGSIWNNVKLWDNHEVAQNYQNARTAGHGVIASAYAAAGTAAAQNVGVDNFATATEGKDFQGKNQSWGQRLGAGAVSGVQLVTTALGIKQAAAGIMNLFRPGAGAAAGTASAGEGAAAKAATSGEAAAVRTEAAAAAEEATGSALNVLPDVNAASDLCFVRSTPVACADGLKSIGGIDPGALVKAFDFAKGRWTNAEVLKRHDRIYNGAMVSIHAGRSVIEATLNHPFWIVKGNELEQRRVPVDLTAGEDERKSLIGRWVMSQDVQAGDLMFGFDSDYHKVERISQRFESSVEVSNLTVRDHHTFAVGEQPLLVHNTVWCDLLRSMKGPKEALTGLVAASKQTGVAIHAHHIVPKTVWTHNSGGPFIREAQAILKKYDIDVLYSDKNLTWALNWDHSIEYAEAIATTLTNAAERGGKEAVLEALDDIATILNKGQKFRGLPN